LIYTHEFDSIIVGGGGSGLYAALEASKNSRTAVISKLYPQRSHTCAAQGGISAALGNLEEDSPEWHAYDTVKGGDYLTDQNAAKILCEEAPHVIYHLEHIGLPFSRLEDGKIAQRRFGGHTHHFGEGAVRRACYAADRTGNMILQTLYQQCVEKDIKFFNEFFATDVILNGNKAEGVVAYELSTGDIHVFAAKAVVFATGGFGRMFLTTSNAISSTGDGPAILTRAGVPLQDMEFYQFHPTGIYRMGILITEGVRGEGGILKNNQGERFMEKYTPTLLDLAPRDIVSRSITTEILNGRGIKESHDIDDYVWLDATHLGKDIIEKRLPDITDFCRTYLDIDPVEKAIPVQPTAHYAMGGIPTDTHGRVHNGNTTYEGLYAVGECACISVHGANRLGTNSLLDLVVFGRRTGMHVAQYVNDTNSSPVRKDAADYTIGRVETLKKKKGVPLGPIIHNMQRIMMQNVGVFRKQEALEQAVKKIEGLMDEIKELGIRSDHPNFNFEIQSTFEAENLLSLSLITAVSAKNREESRGAHQREDFPDRNDDTWLKHTLATLHGEKEINIHYNNVDVSIWDPKPRTY